MTEYGRIREELVLQPVSGKALPVFKGEVLRIVQEVGGTCVDFNCFNLRDYKECMSVGHMRPQGFRIGKGGYLLSAPPRANLMMLILEMPESCATDVLGSRCSADLFEAIYGLKGHTNCQDTIAECIREYGLTPDDTHDSFNLWMYSSWDDSGHWNIRRNRAQRGDFVDLLATMDVLAVPAICGGGDVNACSNFFLKPIRVQIFEGSAATEKLAERKLKVFDGVQHRTVADYKMKEIRTDRELRPDPDYVPEFVNFPLGMREIRIRLSEEDYKNVQRLREAGLGDNDEEAVRGAVMEWYAMYRSRPNPFWFPH